MTKPDFNAQADELIELLDIPRRVHGTLASALRDAYVAGLENASLVADALAKQLREHAAEVAHVDRERERWGTAAAQLECAAGRIRRLKE